MSEKPIVERGGSGAEPDSLFRKYLEVIRDSPKDMRRVVDSEAYARHCLSVMSWSAGQLEQYLQDSDIWSHERVSETQAVVDEIARRIGENITSPDA